MLLKTVELTEGALVLFVGVHAPEWRREWGEPTVGALELGDEDLAEMKRQCAGCDALLAQAGETQGAQVEIAELQSRIAKLESDAALCGDYIEQLVAECATLTRERDVLQRQLQTQYVNLGAAAELMLDEKHAKCNELKAQLAELTEKVRSFRSWLAAYPAFDPAINPAGSLANVARLVVAALKE